MSLFGGESPPPGSCPAARGVKLGRPSLRPPQRDPAVPRSRLPVRLHSPLLVGSAALAADTPAPSFAKTVRQLLEAAGARMDQVVRCTCYLADIGDFAAFDAVYREAFGTALPARTTVQAGLMGIKIEIDAMAYTGP